MKPGFLRLLLWLVATFLCVSGVHADSGAALKIEERDGLRGVVDLNGRVVIPFRYRSISHDSDRKRFKVWLDAADGSTREGYLDERGQVVVPIVYESLQRISNSGDEPTNIARRDGKYGYVDFVTGEVLIEPHYDALRVDPLETDIRGRGIAVARRGDKFGIVSTTDNVIAPFEFDSIGDLDSTGVLAERNGRLVWVALNQGLLVGLQPAPTVYSSNFVPRFASESKPKPFDAMYIAADIADMERAWSAFQDGRLRWAAIPSFQIQQEKAFVSFAVFAQARLPLLQNELAVTQTRNGFTIHLDEQRPRFALSFKPIEGGVACNECAELNLPTQWLRVAPPAPFGGIGVAINKAPEAGSPVVVIDVLAGGPAAKAGLRPNDRIVAIDALDATRVAGDVARDALRGPAGSTVRLRVEREGVAQPLLIDVTRAVIRVSQ